SRSLPRPATHSPETPGYRQSLPPPELHPKPITQCYKAVTQVPECLPRGGPSRDNPATETRPNKKKRHIPTWIALASAVAAIIAAFISGLQVNVARQQNVAAEQQRLLTLTVDIAQQFAQWQKTLDQAGGTLTGPAEMTALSAASVAIYTRVTADGEAAAVLITNLGRNRVAGIEVHRGCQCAC
ncbi:MAG TPA: hypothetical protein VMK13_14055, partial [Streptosporangiaceae bacterium]|nr:hypothetical protein [Streptosporangiaceae bacterium]